MVQKLQLLQKIATQARWKNNNSPIYQSNYVDSGFSPEVHFKVPVLFILKTLAVIKMVQKWHPASIRFPQSLRSSAFAMCWQYKVSERHNKWVTQTLKLPLSANPVGPFMDGLLEVSITQSISQSTNQYVHWLLQYQNQIKAQVYTNSHMGFKILSQ